MSHMFFHPNILRGRIEDQDVWGAVRDAVDLLRHHDAAEPLARSGSDLEG